MIKLSVVIPSYKDPYLNKTIMDLLENSELGDALEIVVVCDGYWCTPIDDKRVRYVHLGQNRGMRGAINAGVAVARGEFFMRLDEHCSFGQGFDKILTDACKENEVMTAVRYFLNPETWTVMDLEPVYHERLDIVNVSEGVRKFHGKTWKKRDEEQKDVMVSETLAMQGSMWIAHREFFLKTVGELQTEGYGPLIQDSVEVCMKYWNAGGRLMLNKNTWFAHKHRSFKRTHNNGTAENPAKCEDGYTYALQQWEKYYTDVIRPKWNI
ncbi:MAG: glycosyltransferase family 2 protein [Sphingomonas sp.]|jgi:glycosyltransferase involved in cell wall biosynthesis